MKITASSPKRPRPAVPTRTASAALPVALLDELAEFFETVGVPTVVAAGPVANEAAVVAAVTPVAAVESKSMQSRRHIP